jgi:hypothetical protein
MGLYSSLGNLNITYSSDFGIDLNLKKFVKVYCSLGNMIITHFGYLGTSMSMWNLLCPYFTLKPPWDVWHGLTTLQSLLVGLQPMADLLWFFFRPTKALGRFIALLQDFLWWFKVYNYLFEFEIELVMFATFCWTHYNVENLCNYLFELEIRLGRFVAFLGS